MVYVCMETAELATTDVLVLPFPSRSDLAPSRPREILVVGLQAVAVRFWHQSPAYQDADKCISTLQFFHTNCFAGVCGLLGGGWK